MQLIRTKQIENGAAIVAALAAVHPAATIASSAAPFTFNSASQSANIPLPPSFAVSGNTLTITPGDGSAPVTFAVSLGADVFLQQTGSVYDSATATLKLSLTNGTFVNIPLSDLIPIQTVDSGSVDFSGNGTGVSPLTGVVKISSTAGNQLTTDASGLYVATPTTVVASSETVEVSGSGVVGTPYKFNVKLQPDSSTAHNFIHKTGSALSNDDSQLGLGYTVVPIEFTGPGPFNVASAVAALGWNTAEIIDIEGYVNGVFYEGTGGPGYAAATGDSWNFSNTAAVTWAGTAGGGLFNLDAQDNIKFRVHARAS